MSAHVCVVIPCYNAEPWIAKTIESALSQSHPHTSVVVVDDGSSDGSVDRVRAFGNRVTLRTGPNRGACHARNAGHAIAKTQSADYVVFLDADDYFEGEILAGAVAAATEYAADMVLSDMHLEYEDGRREVRHRYSGDVAPEEFFLGWMRGDYINPPGILWRSGFVDEIGGWDESLARAQDLDITLRALLERPRIRKNETGAAIHARLNPNSITRNQSEKALRSRYTVSRRLAERVAGTSFAPAEPLLCQELYHIARAAFKAGHVGLGREVLAFVQAQGYRKHPGTRMHALVAGVLGLETKVRLWKG